MYRGENEYVFWPRDDAIRKCMEVCDGGGIIGAGLDAILK